MEFTWSDYGDPKGFHIFDTDTREMTKIKNPIRMFEKVFYDDTKLYSRRNTCNGFYTFKRHVC